MKRIIELKSNEVFVCGVNSQGFHGAGSAGYAQRGDAKNTWRTDPAFQEALLELNKKNKNQPYDAEKLIGKWSVLGQNGFMEGREGKSYGLITTERPAFQGKVDDNFLVLEISKFLVFAIKHPQYFFLCCDFGLNKENGGYSWWTPPQLQKIWNTAFQLTGKFFDWDKSVSVTPDNVKYPSYIDFEGNPVELLLNYTYEKYN